MVLINLEHWQKLTLHRDALTTTSSATHEDVLWRTNWIDARPTDIISCVFNCQIVEGECGFVHITGPSDLGDSNTTARGYGSLWTLPSYISSTGRYFNVYCSIQSYAATQGGVGWSEYRGFNTNRRYGNCIYREKNRIMLYNSLQCTLQGCRKQKETCPANVGLHAAEGV